jgi:hypothetical protein
MGGELAAVIAAATAEAVQVTSTWQAGDDAVRAAQARHPAQALALWHGFQLLAPTHPRMTGGAPFVFAGHCRELLDRLAAGADTRPATAAEVVLACAGASQLAPLNPTGHGLYLRAWHLAFPDQEVMPDGEHYEAIRGDEIDQALGGLRRKMTAAWRVMDPATECDGEHWGEPVTGCPYAAAAPALDTLW